MKNYEIKRLSIGPLVSMDVEQGGGAVTVTVTVMVMVMLMMP